MTKPKYFSGPPPSVGWWPTGSDWTGDFVGYRWWDGICWSFAVYKGESAKTAGAYASMGSGQLDIRWTHRPASWPARSKT